MEAHVKSLLSQPGITKTRKPIPIETASRFALKRRKVWKWKYSMMVSESQLRGKTDGIPKSLYGGTKIIVRKNQERL